MNLVVVSTLLVLLGHQVSQISADSDQRTERQSSNYEFPGVRKAQYEDLIERYDPSARVAAAQTYNPSVADPSDYSGQSYRPAAASRSRTPSYRSDKEEEDAKRAAEEEEEKKPDRLALLLAESKFTCDDKKDGYYADETVQCQVFHYCVAGAKHSWQCPENTVFHQIHLNCVPAAQDICTQSSKFHVVNDYLHKALEQRGPNNTIRYAQRFYPEGFDFGGDVLSQVLPQSQPQRPPQRYRDSDNSYRDSDEYEPPRGNSRSSDYPSYQSYPAPAPAARSSPPARQVFKPPVVRTSPQSYNAPSYTTASQPKPTARPVSYSTPSLYSSTYSDSDSDSDSGYDSYPSAYSPSSSASTYSAPSSASYSAPSSSSYSAPSSSSYSAPTSSYPSSSYSAGSLSSSYPSSSAGSSASLSSYRPVQSVKPAVASYPSRSIGIPIASFRVSSAPQQSYGSSPSASRISSAAYPSPARFSLGAFTSEMASGVKYDEDY